tara:strand:+ start:309 stop:533 length:225 start_codon:yes stop_codon:yes gene_type:complete
MTKEFETNDLSIAAFLLMRGLRLLSAEKSKSGKFIFLFSDPDDKAKQLSIEFLNSDFCEYDNHVRNLRRIIYSK